MFPENYDSRELRYRQLFIALKNYCLYKNCLGFESCYPVDWRGKFRFNENEVRRCADGGVQSILTQFAEQEKLSLEKSEDQKLVEQIIGHKAGAELREAFDQLIGDKGFEGQEVNEKPDKDQWIREIEAIYNKMMSERYFVSETTKELAVEFLAGLDKSIKKKKIERLVKDEGDQLYDSRYEYEAGLE